ncbi:MAG: hypothetical protein COV55_04925 [Candidatus Komeilibacteria bacterium CG11_big_fil_rev_8_21_14_0_20_36_20]|uniref:DUF5667 domain-containing protein n=1 Tax=Candidatus Komeilibacteria bacterium CG11_big_fil_rev_8_21_14_0_20_36_20 TaxID=1974477 RepID=A0A2H0NAX7_9BACT|nr:MAG: hypothetical protein COV55_04925 [Candidatus Komeilibacteria bacterium CG11_big_fil_rev_8_21_14_0_20_36_20]PIR82044.1 MAG: hypothetical protein COU21_00160 [Candidatus Komeilibacteria bacterium CG10_big_fil_rev_8_21_14_0_10_36_65]PJC55023.1 MAG: hypothetical protein CO027_04145 [Candidatus Komeilibacteria bacterium CG_4_9_14_0_2_um_filter_36_13]
MKFYKLINLAVLFSLIICWPLSSQATSNATDLQNLSVEFASDEVSADSLNIEEPTTLPGDSGYWWTSLKKNVDLWLTFNPVKKTEKELQLANTKLLEAEKLVESGQEDNNHLTKTLKKYESLMQKVTARITENKKDDSFQNLLSRLDRDQLQHQQILEKLTSQVSEAKADFINNVSQSTAQQWYEIDKADVKDRLEKAVSQNNVGSDFKQLRNMATLEEMKDILPTEAEASIEAAQDAALDKLHLKIKNLDEEGNNKLEKYLRNIQIHEISMQRLLDHLEDINLPEQTKARITEVKEANLERLKDHFENLIDEKKDQWLEKFKTQGDVTHLDILDSLKDSATQEYKDKLQNLEEIQRDMIKTDIKNTTDENKLNNLENKTSNNPVLQKEIQERKYEIRANSDNQLKSNTDTLRPLQ